MDGLSPIERKKLKARAHALDPIIHLGGKGLTEYRRQKVPQFPFGILYLVRDEVLEVVAFAHERRRPGYWSKRDW